MYIYIYIYSFCYLYIYIGESIAQRKVKNLHHRRLHYSNGTNRICVYFYICVCIKYTCVHVYARAHARACDRARARTSAHACECRSVSFIYRVRNVLRICIRSDYDDGEPSSLSKFFVLSTSYCLVPDL